jgi:DNA-binding MarR family transcriptional regulator
VTTRAADTSECQACLCFAVRRAARLVTQRYDAHLRPAGLRGTQFTLLVVLKNAGPQPLHRLARFLGMERTTLTRNLTSLLGRGYVSDQPGSDRRVRTISLTPAGADAVARALPHWRKAQREFAARLGAGAVAALAQLSHTSD